MSVTSRSERHDVEIDQHTARRVILHLKAGTTPIDCVQHLNVGNERWYAAASEHFDEVAADGDAMVRFVKGYYGDGKTHFLGMLRSIAFSKHWLVTYVTAEGTPLHKFDLVYGELVRNLMLPPGMRLPEWLSEKDSRGAAALLAALFARLYLEAYRLSDRSGLHKERVLAALREKSVELAADTNLHELMGRAVKAYVEAVIRGDTTKMHAVSSWLEGADVKVADEGLTRRIDQKLSRDATRSISVLVQRAGAGGVLILLDEAERIMEQSRSVRNKSYGVIRDLLDNADEQGGMRSSIVYVAATPETFQSAKGFPEYDALRSRLASSTRFAVPGFVDWRAVVVDLTQTPMPHDLLVQLAARVVEIHGCARNWAAAEIFTAEVVNRIVSAAETNAFTVSKPRLLTSCMATLLEMIEQNRSCAVASLLDATLETVHSSLVHKSETTQWE